MQDTSQNTFLQNRRFPEKNTNYLSSKIRDPHFPTGRSDVGYHSLLWFTVRGIETLFIVVLLENTIKERRKEMFYLTTDSTHFIYGYMALNIW